MRILLVEDDQRQADFIVKGLVQERITIDHVDDGEKGLQAAISTPYDVLIIDLMLPKIDGLTLIQGIRSNGVTTPVLVLSARHDVDDRVAGLQAGGDDYMGKPYAFSELYARIQALYRRATGLTDGANLDVGDLRFDVSRHVASRSGQVLDLQPKEYVLLEYLARNTGRVVSKTMIMEHVWGYNMYIKTNVIEARISRLRDKVDRPFTEKLIHTVRGVGYVLELRDLDV